jgi:hypothetical protein
VRRATAALLGTVVGTTLLVDAKYGSGPTSGTGVSNSQPLGESTPGSGVGANGPTAGPTAPNAAPVPGGTTAKPGGGGGTTTPGGVTRTTPAAPPAAPACTTAAGNPTRVSSPGIGTVTVTIKVCGGALTTSSGVLSQSNWSKNTNAVPALNSMAVQYYKTNFSQIHYSGASLTSAAYQTSLRSAMTKAGI